MIARRAWSDAAERGLIESAGRDMAAIRRQVQSGHATLWECASDRHHAWIVTRLEADESGAEWVIMCFEGTGSAEFFPLFIQAAKERGLSMRAHMTVRRPGLLRIMRRFGFEPTETVVRRPR